MPTSVIGSDLTIMGQDLKIMTKGTLRIDGDIQGDLHGQEIIVGESGKVTGTITAERVIVRGEVAGTVRGVSVSLHASAHVEGDIHHRTLAVEQGAHMEGRIRRVTDAAELRPGFDLASSGQGAVTLTEPVPKPA